MEEFTEIKGEDWRSDISGCENYPSHREVGEDAVLVIFLKDGTRRIRAQANLNSGVCDCCGDVIDYKDVLGFEIRKLP